MDTKRDSSTEPSNGEAESKATETGATPADEPARMLLQHSSGQLLGQHLHQRPADLLRLNERVGQRQGISDAVSD